MRVAALVFVVLASAAGTAGGATTSLPRCHTPGLHVYLLPSGAAAGSYAFDIAFQNRSGHACFVYGYPGLGLQDARHRVMPSRVTWGAALPAATPGGISSS